MMSLERRSLNDKTFDISIRLQEANSKMFLAQPTTVVVFVDQKRLKEIKPQGLHVDLDVPLHGLSAGSHVLAVNWVSEYGPVSVSAIEFAVPGPIKSVQKAPAESRQEVEKSIPQAVAPLKGDLQ